MKIHTKIILLLLGLLFQNCVDHPKQNQFSASDDTLIVRTEKHRGDGLFVLGVMPVIFKDTVDQLANSVVIPRQITNVKRFQILTDFKSKESYSVDLMSGLLYGKDIFIVDENDNKDFTDDSIRLYRPIKWDSDKDLIKCNFLISNGREIVKESSWIRIGILYGDIWCGRSEHLIADFAIDRERFKVGVIDSRLFGFSYGIFPEAAVISHNDEFKDTLFQKDIISKGEYLNLNGNYYRFENVSNNGEHITLVKETDFNKKIGTQVGMIAPDFICKTVGGDTIISSVLHDRIIIIANSCGCGGDSKSTQAYFDIRNLYKDNIHILRLDSNIDKNLDGWQIDISDKFNSDFYSKYRNEYCSRICYVVDKNNRIIDKFPISKWDSDLPKLIKTK